MEQYPVRIPKYVARRPLIGHDQYKPVEAEVELKDLLRPVLEKARLLEPTFNQETFSLAGLIALTERTLRNPTLVPAGDWLDTHGQDTRPKIEELLSRLKDFLRLNGIEPKNTQL